MDPHAAMQALHDDVARFEELARIGARPEDLQDALGEVIEQARVLSEWIAQGGWIPMGETFTAPDNVIPLGR